MPCFSTNSGWSASRAEWPHALAGTGPRREEALARLHGLLLRTARGEVARRGPRLQLTGPELDDLAYQAATLRHRGATRSRSPVAPQPTPTTKANRNNYGLVISSEAADSGGGFAESQDTPAGRAVVGRHLVSCPRRRDKVAGLAGIPAMLRQVPASRRRRRRRLAAAAAVLAAAPPPVGATAAASRSTAAGWVPQRPGGPRRPADPTRRPGPARP